VLTGPPHPEVGALAVRLVDPDGDHMPWMTIELRAARDTAVSRETMAKMPLTVVT